MLAKLALAISILGGYIGGYTSGEPPAEPADYYVDPDTGNDANVGTSPATAWRSLPGARTANDSGYLRSNWGAINTTDEVPCGSLIVLKGGSTYASDDGGSWRINGDYYTDAGCSADPIVIRVATAADWPGASGPFTVDASGITGTDAAGYADPAFLDVELDDVRIGGASASAELVIEDPGNNGVRATCNGCTVERSLVEYVRVRRAGFVGFSFGNTDLFTIRQSHSENSYAAGFACGLLVDQPATRSALVDVTVDGAGFGGQPFGSADGLFLACRDLKVVRAEVERFALRGYNSGALNDTLPINRMISLRDVAFHDGGWFNGYPGQATCFTPYTGNWNAPCTPSNDPVTGEDTECTGVHPFGGDECVLIGSNGSAIHTSGRSSTSTVPNDGFTDYSVVVGMRVLNAADGAVGTYGGGSVEIWNASILNPAADTNGAGETGAAFHWQDDAENFRVFNTVVQAYGDDEVWEYSGCSSGDWPDGIGPLMNWCDIEEPEVEGNNCYRHLSSTAEDIGMSHGTYAVPATSKLWIDSQIGAGPSVGALTFDECLPDWESVHATDWSQMDFTPGPSSSLFDAGRFLMLADGAGTGTTIDVVGNGGQTDPRVFFIGADSYLEPTDADRSIQIEGCGVRRVVSMTATSITFDGGSCTWGDGAGVSLPWGGITPDIGAVEIDAPRLAFPGAVGFGAYARVGGAGESPTVCSVTNTNASGAGSLQACIGSGQSDQIVVIKTGGTATLTGNAITVTGNRNLISGSRAPGGGFALSRTEGSGFSGLLSFNGDDNVIRNVRLRSAPPTCALGASTDAIQVGDSVRRFYGDRISASWGSDEVCNWGGSTAKSGPVQVTQARSICAENILMAACDPDVGGNGAILDEAEGITLWKNVIGLSRYRMPNSGSGGVHDLVNNLFPKSETDGGITTFIDCDDQDRPYRANLRGNKWQMPTPTGKELRVYGQRNCQADGSGVGDGCDGIAIYASGNDGWSVDPADDQSALFDCNRQGLAPDDYGCGVQDGVYTVYSCGADPDNYYEVADQHPLPYTLAAVDIADQADEILADAGALPRDAVDTCMAAKVVANNSTEVVDSRTNGCNGGPATLAAGTWCEGLGGDTDADHLCDDWETSTFGGLGQSALGDFDGDGYLNVEEFLNEGY